MQKLTENKVLIEINVQMPDLLKVQNTRTHFLALWLQKKRPLANETLTFPSCFGDALEKSLLKLRDDREIKDLF